MLPPVQAPPASAVTSTFVSSGRNRTQEEIEEEEDKLDREEMEVFRIIEEAMARQKRIGKRRRRLSEKRSAA